MNCWLDLFKPLLPPEKEAGPVTQSKIPCPMAHYSIEYENTFAPLHKVVAFIEEFLYRFKYLLSRPAIGPHLLNKSASLKLVPLTQGSLDFMPRADTNEITGSKAQGTRIKAHIFSKQIPKIIQAPF